MKTDTRAFHPTNGSGLLYCPSGFRARVFPRIALSAEASDAEAAVQPGTRYRHVMSPNHLVGNIVSQGVKSFAQGRGPKLLVPDSPRSGSAGAQGRGFEVHALAWRIFLKTEYVVAPQTALATAKRSARSRDTLVLSGQRRRNT
jgi:hypothetical protein